MRRPVLPPAGLDPEMSRFFRSTQPILRRLRLRFGPEVGVIDVKVGNYGSGAMIHEVFREGCTTRAFGRTNFSRVD